MSHFVGVEGLGMGYIESKRIVLWDQGPTEHEQSCRFTRCKFKNEDVCSSDRFPPTIYDSNGSSSADWRSIASEMNSEAPGAKFLRI
jgi:hypothetical protein